MGNVLHVDERRQFERLLTRQKLDRLADRVAVVEAFLNSEDHLTPAECRELLTDSRKNLGLDFVIETLDLLVKFGLAEKRDFEGFPSRYEHRHLGEHHDHLICTRCGVIKEFQRPDLEAQKHKIAQEHGFHHLKHTLQIYGLCSKCCQDQKTTMPLAMASPGEVVRIERVVGPSGPSEGVGDGMLAKQLMGMGIKAGARIEVISSDGGSIVAAVDGTRIALSRKAALNIHVSLIS